MADFDKLGRDRLSQNIQRAFGTPASSLVTGDITRGAVVTLSFDGTTTTLQETVKARRTGAIPIELYDSAGDAHEIMWYIENTTLYVVASNGTPANGSYIKFWVF